MQVGQNRKIEMIMGESGLWAVGSYACDRDLCFLTQVPAVQRAICIRISQDNVVQAYVEHRQALDACRCLASRA